MPFGKQAMYNNDYYALEIVLQNDNGEKVSLQMRAYNDGTALCFY